MSSYDFTNCTLCPRECGANRITGAGACGADYKMRVSKIMLHRFEEPPISGTRGSGAIFFGGCNLRCGYCQNAEISQNANSGEAYSASSLADAMLDLRQRGAHNINLVTAAHFVPQAAEALALAKPRLKIPVVYNSSGYEKPETLRLLDGLVDIYLPDYKYCSGEAARKYSGAEDYPQVAVAAIAEMLRQVGEYRQEQGLAVRGVIIRHLVLPGMANDGVTVMRNIAERFGNKARVSIMRQYTPEFNRTGDSLLDRRVTSYEYNKVLKAAQELGLHGFMQYGGSADARYTPDFGAQSNGV